MRYANRADLVAFGQPQGNLKESRQHVYVLVSVEVCWLNSCVAYFFDLRLPFLLDLMGRQSAASDAEQQVLRATGELPRIVHQTGDQLPRSYGGAVTQIQMYASPGVDRATSTPEAKAAPLASSDALVTIP